jgi:hypothetical protein
LAFQDEYLAYREQLIREELDSNHRKYLLSRRKPTAGTKPARPGHRQTHCHCHRAWLDNRFDRECENCNGIVCYVCGGCLC